LLLRNSMFSGPTSVSSRVNLFTATGSYDLSRLGARSEIKPLLQRPLQVRL